MFNNIELWQGDYMSKKNITKSEWRRICIQLDRHVDYEEVQDMTLDEAIQYIRTLNIFVPDK